MRLIRRPIFYVPVAIVLFGLIVWRTHAWQSVGELAKMRPEAILVVLLLDVALIVLWADRSASLLGGLGHHLSRQTLAPIVILANTMNNLTPASTGEAVRAYILRARHGIPLRSGAPVIIMERLYAFYLMIVTAVGLALVEVVQKPLFVIVSFAVLVGLTFAPNLAYEFLHVRPVALAGRIVRRLVPGPRSARIANVLAEVDVRLDILLTNPVQALGFAGRTLLIFAAYAAQLTVILWALGEPIPLWSAWAVYGLAMVAGVLSGLPFGLGATDGVLAVLLVTLGTSEATTGLAAILLRLFQTLPIGLLGVIAYVHLSRSLPAEALHPTIPPLEAPDDAVVGQGAEPGGRAAAGRG